jgi:glycosyltransferase involved in cell wall biosynthesis
MNQPDHEPKVDVLLSVYNGALYLEQQIHSILNQTYGNWRLLIRDDRSTDHSLDIIKRYRDQYPDRIFLDDQEPRNLGASRSFGYLLEKADAPYMMFCDQDDVWYPDKIEISLTAMRRLESEYPDKPVLVHTDLEVVNASLEKISDSFWKYQKLNGDARTLNQLLVQNHITGCTMMINRRLRDLCLPIPEEAIMHDWWIAAVCAAFGNIVSVPRPTIKYRQHGNNEVGAKRFDWKTAFGLVSKRKQLLENIRKAVRQAEKFHIQYKALLNPKDLEMVRKYMRITHFPRIYRLYLLVKYRLYKFAFIRNIGYMIMLLLVPRR